MVRLCQVCRKLDNLNPNLSFHRFPRDEQVKQAWFLLLGFPKDKILPKVSFICSNHFAEDDFVVQQSRLLKPMAVPVVVKPKPRLDPVQEIRLTKNRYASWMYALGLDPKDQQYSTCNRICSAHFDKRYINITPCGRMLLAHGAIPELNLGPNVQYRKDILSQRKALSELVKTEDIDSMQESFPNQPVFPNEVERRELWLKSLKMDNASKWHYVCSKHFLDSDFYSVKSKLKMLKKSAVPSLSSIESPILSFSFPVKPERRKRWLALLDLENQRVNKYAQVCSGHFDKSDIIRTQVTGRRQIRPNAEPQLNTNVFTEPLSYRSVTVKSEPEFEQYYTPSSPPLPTATYIKPEPELEETNPISPLTTTPCVKNEPEFEETIPIPPLYKIGTMTVHEGNFQSSNPNAVYLRDTSRSATSSNVQSDPKGAQNIPRFSQVATVSSVQSEPRSTQNISNVRDFPELIKIGTMADLPDYLPSAQKIIYLNDSSRLGNVLHVNLPSNTPHAISQENMSTNIPHVVSQENISSSIKIVNVESMKNVPSYLNSSLNQQTRGLSTDKFKDVPAVGIIPYEEFRSENDALSDSSSTDTASETGTLTPPSLISTSRHDGQSIAILSSETSNSSADSSVGVAGCATERFPSHLINANPLRPILKQTTSTFEPKINPPKRVTINQPIRPSTSSRLSLHREQNKEPTTAQYRQYRSILPKALPMENQPVQSISIISDSSTDSASEAEDNTMTSPIDQLGQDGIKSVPSSSLNRTKVKGKQKPKLLQYIEQTLATDSLTEEQLVEMLESDSPLLTPELMFCKKSNTQPTKRYFGDLTIDDFETDEEKQEFLNAQKRIKTDRTTLTRLYRRNRTLKSKLAKTQSVVNKVASLCDVSHIKKYLEEEVEVSSNESSSSSDDDIYAEEANNVPSVDLDEATMKIYEQNETQIDSFELANQVQVTFLAGRETANESSLRKELDKRAKKDISRSKKIKLLNNTILMKNTLIDDLKNELAKLRNVV